MAYVRELQGALLGCFCQNAGYDGTDAPLNDHHLSDFEAAGAMLVEVGLLKRVGEHTYRVVERREDR